MSTCFKPLHSGKNISANVHSSVCGGSPLLATLSSNHCLAWSNIILMPQKPTSLSSGNDLQIALYVITPVMLKMMSMTCKTAATEIVYLFN